MNRLLLVGVSLMLAGTIAAQPQPTAQPAPLFADDAVLDLTLATDLTLLFQDRSETRPSFPAILTLRSTDGRSESLDIKVKLRGNHRLDTCGFPPIRLNFPEKGASGTLFEGQDKVKLVTHCQPDKPAYEQYVLLEYLAYRTFAQITDFSLQVRLARITYHDTGGTMPATTTYAFLIEPEEVMAARNGGFIETFQRYTYEEIDPDFMALVAVFQYLIGNTDWIVHRPHNLIYVLTSLDRPFAVPYDFDWSGLVNAPYSFPRTDVGIDRVTQRHYVGPCRKPETLAPTLAVFQAEREALYALYREVPGLDDKQRKRIISFLDDFYKVLDSKRRLQAAFNVQCGIYD